jgi:hypothetical protein
MASISDKQNKGSFAKSAVAGGFIQATKDTGAGTIQQSRGARDVVKCEFIQPDSTVVDQFLGRLGRPFEWYWPADNDVNDDDGLFYGFFASVFPTVTDDDGDQNLLYALGNRKTKPITGAAVTPRTDLTGKHAIPERDSRGYPQERMPSRVRELAVKRMWGLTAEGAGRAGRMTLEEPLMISAWRSDPKHSNLVYDVQKGELSNRYIARVSDLIRVSVNEKNVPALAMNYGGAPDNACIGHGFAYNNGGNFYLSMTRGGPLFLSDASVIDHGINLEGEVVKGAMLKFCKVAPDSGRSGGETSAAGPSSGSGSYFFGEATKQGPLVYDGRDYKRGRGMRVVEAWFAWDSKVGSVYPKCGGTGQTQGAFRMNSWVNVFDPSPGDTPPPPRTPPEDPPQEPPQEPPTGGPPAPPSGGDEDTPPTPEQPRPPQTREGGSVDDNGNYIGDTGRRPTAEEYKEWKAAGGEEGTGLPFGDWVKRKRGATADDTGASDRIGEKGPPTPAVGTVEERRPSYSGIPIPPSDSAPNEGGDNIPGVGGSEENYAKAEEEGILFDVAADIQPSQREREIGVDYSQFPSSTEVTNSVWYDRFSYDTTQQALRNLIRAPHTAHLQTVAKYDADNQTWDVDSNESAYGRFDGASGGAPTVVNTLFVMPPNIDLGQSDIDPSSGVTATGFAVHRGNDNGFLGVGVPDYTTGKLKDGFDITYDSQGIKIVARDTDGNQDNSADIYFNGASISGGGTSYWDRDTTGDPFIEPSNAGDDVLIDGVIALGTAAISSLRGLNLGQSTVSGSDNFDTFRATQTIVNGSTGDHNVFSLVQSAEGTSSRSNVRGFAINVSNIATGGTVSDFSGGEIVVTNNGSGSTTTRKYGMNIRLIGTNGTVATQYGIRADIEGTGTTSIGIEGRIDTGTHTYSYGLVGQGTGSITVSGMHAGAYLADNVGNGSGRSVAALLKGDLGFTTNEVTRPVIRFNPDTTNQILDLDNYAGTAVHLRTSGCVEATGGYKSKLVVITAAGATHSAAWGESIVVDTTSGTGDIDIDIPPVATATDGDNIGKSIDVFIFDNSSENVNVNMTSGESMIEGVSPYDVWQGTLTNEALSIKAVYNEQARVCCRSGGAFDPPS